MMLRGDVELEFSKSPCYRGVWSFYLIGKYRWSLQFNCVRILFLVGSALIDDFDIRVTHHGGGITIANVDSSFVMDYALTSHLLVVIRYILLYSPAQEIMKLYFRAQAPQA